MKQFIELAIQNDTYMTISTVTSDQVTLMGSNDGQDFLLMVPTFTIKFGEIYSGIPLDELMETLSSDEVEVTIL